MNLSFFIAKRYFLSRKKKSFINVISIISMLVVAIGTMALIIVLSVFNGLEGLLRTLYGSVDPNLVVTAKIGKSFDYSQELRNQVTQQEGVASITEVLEDNALIRYNKAQRVARVKGVSEEFIEQGRLEAYIVYGEHELYEKKTPQAIVGRGVQYDLSVNPANDFYTLQMYFPEDIGPGVVNPERMYRVRHILPGAVFAVEKSYDENYIFVPITFAEELFAKQGQRSALEIAIKEGYASDELKTSIASRLGDDFLVRSNEEIHGGLYRIMKYEKFFLFLTFSVIIAIASINIFFSLTMLAIDKKKDVAILAAQGASRRFIRNIFLLEGCIVAFTGAFTGLVLGLLISFLQQEFGIVGMGVQSAILDAYPIKVQWPDVIFTVLSIVIITMMTAVQPAIKASKTVEIKNLQ